MRRFVLSLLALCLTASAAWGGYPPWPLCIAPGDQTSPRQGGARVYWVDARDPSAPDLFGSAKLDSTPAPFVAAAGWQTDLSVAPGGGAPCVYENQPVPPVLTAMVVWVDTRTGDLDLRVKADGYGLGWSAVDLPLCSAPGFQTDPRVVRASSDLSSFIVGWLDRRSGSNREVYAQLVNGTGAAQWAADGVPVCAVPGYCSDLDVVADGAGGAYLAWTQPAGGVRVQRITDAGVAAPGWPANGLDVSGATAETAARPRIVSDGNGGVLIVWEDLRATGLPVDADIYAQHLTGSGSVVGGWPTAGLPITTAFQDQWPAGVVTDNSGGAIVVWEDGRNRVDEQLSPDYDVRALRITGAGAVASGWNADGTVVCDRPFAQSNATAINDGAAGVYIAWEDRNGSEAPPDIRASHLEGNGQLPAIWPAGGEDGVVICDAAGAQTEPSLGWSCWPGVLVAWVDERDAATTGKDIYAVNMTASGRVDVPQQRSTRLALGAPAPNPSHAISAARVDLPEAMAVEAWVADIAGRRIAVLAAGETWSAGTRELRWDGRDASGRAVRAGVYTLHVRAGAWSAVRSIVRLR
jgi:hypothetical protein